MAIIAHTAVGNMKVISGVICIFVILVHHNNAQEEVSKEYQFI